MTKTNVMRILDKLEVKYNSLEYEYDENDLSGVSVASKNGLDPERVFKTLVCVDESGANKVFCIPVEYELDLKKCARVSDVKRIEMIHVKDLLKVTGYIRGGCSPVGMKKQFPTFIDETAQLFDTIYVSGGLRGVQIELSPLKLAEIINARFCDLLK